MGSVPGSFSPLHGMPTEPVQPRHEVLIETDEDRSKRNRRHRPTTPPNRMTPTPPVSVMAIGGMPLSLTMTSSILFRNRAIFGSSRTSSPYSEHHGGP